MGDMIADNDHLLGRCLDLAGSDKAGMLLFRMHWWSRKSKVERGGRKWMVRPTDWWAAEVRATPKQVRTALGDLKSRGLIIAEVHLFAGKTRSFIRLAEKALEGLSAEALEGQTSSALEGQTGEALEGQTYDKGEVEGSSVMEKSEHPLAAASPSTGGTLGEDEGMKGVKSVMDIEAAVKAQKVLHKPNTPKALGAFWAKRVNEITDAFVVLKEKDYGQLKHFANACPPGRAEQVLMAVLEDWIAFAKKCETMAGVKNSPSVPSVGFLLQHVQIAIILVSPKKTPSKHEAQFGLSLSEAVQLTAQDMSKPTPKPEVQKPKSLAEIWADPDEDDE